MIAAIIEAMPVMPDITVHFSFFFRNQKNVPANIAPMSTVAAAER